MGKDTPSARTTNHHKNSAYFKMPLIDAIYKKYSEEIAVLFDEIRSAIENSKVLLLEDILSTLEQADDQKLQAVIYAIHNNRWGYNQQDPILTAIGGYDHSGYQSEILKILLKSKLGAILKDNTYAGKKVTALHIACLYNNEDASNQLIAAGFNPLAEDIHGRTPRDYGRKQAGFCPELEFENGTLNYVEKVMNPGLISRLRNYFS